MAGATILQAVPRLDAGGSEQAAIEIAAALTRAGASALVATEGGRMATAMTEAGGKIIGLPMASKNPLTLLANARRLARLIETRSVNLVHARSRAPAWSAFLAASRTSLVAHLAPVDVDPEWFGTCVHSARLEHAKNCFYCYRIRSAEDQGEGR